MSAQRRLTIIHAAGCALAVALGEMLTEGSAGLSQLTAARWCLASLVAFLSAVVVIGVLGARAIRGRQDLWAMMATAMAPLAIGIVGGAAALASAQHARGSEGASMLSIEIAMSALWYGLTLTGAALFAARVGAACAARAAVTRAGLGPSRGRVMGSGRVVAALLGPTLAGLVLFWGSDYLPTYANAALQSHVKVASIVAAGEVGSHFQRHHRCPGTRPLALAQITAPSLGAPTPDDAAHGLAGRLRDACGILLGEAEALCTGAWGRHEPF